MSCSFIVSLALPEGPRYYELCDGSLSMTPIRHHEGVPIWSAERLLNDLSEYLEEGKQLVATRYTPFEEVEEE